MIYSYSRLSTYRGEYACPCKFYLKYVRGIPEPTTSALTLGKAAHAVIAAGLKNKTPELYPFCQAVGAAVEMEADELFQLVSHPAVARAVGIAEPENVECHFEYPIGDVTFQGYIDCYSVGKEKIVLIDWKTNQMPYEVTETYQLALYAAHLTQKYGLPVEGHLVFLRPRAIKSHLFTREEIGEAVAWATETAWKIERLLESELLKHMPFEVFPPCPGKACEHCGYTVQCPGLLADETDAITSIEKAETTALEILVLEAKLKAYKERLKNWVETHGPVQANGKEFLIQETFYWKWSDEAHERAVALMVEQGYDPLKILRLTADGLKKLSWDEEQIAELGAQKVVSQRFDSRKARG
ncbi:MAG: PD-(D/E)XK nuclease family protein [Syntrophothermus sp.]|uniref:PD-(D/E)XK nuclease family protein n=1 Tax=Syntrophothermus sp. TaxID=2736299 RepID=UPI00257C008E|nr:PD-(D/E)XK nuclease family protein [Syntrophothermus sp.]NSW83914.1 PD-(D/E)XK nuclease family protein [Syntrophothermus sp.]